MIEKPSIDEIADDIIRGVTRLMKARHSFNYPDTTEPLTVDQAVAIMGVAIQCDMRNELCDQLERMADAGSEIKSAIKDGSVELSQAIIIAGSG